MIYGVRGICGERYVLLSCGGGEREGSDIAVWGIWDRGGGSCGLWMGLGTTTLGLGDGMKGSLDLIFWVEGSIRWCN